MKNKLRRILKIIALAVRMPPWLWSWAPTIVDVLDNWQAIVAPDSEGYSYASPWPEFLDPTSKEDSREFSRRLDWAIAHGLIDHKSDAGGDKTRINDPDWWWKAGIGMSAEKEGEKEAQQV